MSIHVVFQIADALAALNYSAHLLELAFLGPLQTMPKSAPCRDLLPE